MRRRKDVGRNGTYLVMRQLRQDVRSFWQFVYERSGGKRDGSRQTRRRLRRRTRAGDPLVPTQSQPIPGIDPKDAAKNNFTFAQNKDGTRCPFGAHVHRANPRNADFEGGPTRIKKLITMLGFGRMVFATISRLLVHAFQTICRGREWIGLTEGTPRRRCHSGPETCIQFVWLSKHHAAVRYYKNAWMSRFTKFFVADQAKRSLSITKRRLNHLIVGDFCATSNGRLADNDIIQYCGNYIHSHNFFYIIPCG